MPMPKIWNWIRRKRPDLFEFSRLDRILQPPPQQPEKQPAVQAQPDVPVETPQTESKRQPSKGALRTMSDRLLNVVTADNGQNAAAVVGRVQFSSEYRGRRDGSVQLESVARVDIPLGERFVVRTDLPFLWFDPQTSGSTSMTGFGDFSMRLGGQVWRTPGFTLWPEAISFSRRPAAQSSVGESIKSVPGLPCLSRCLELNSVVFPTFQHITSVGGDPSRNDVNYTRLRIVPRYSLV
mgnify:CR=1 FL=1